MLDLIISGVLGSGVTLIVLGAIFWLSKIFVTQYVNNYVVHEFNKRIETYKAELQAKHQEQQHFHEILKQALSEENKELKARKILAVDGLWKSLISLKKFSFAVKFRGALNFEEIKKRANDPKIQTFLNAFQNCSFADLLKEAEATKDNPSELARPWVSHKAWSLYLAYTTIIYYTICQFESAKIGGALDETFDEKKMIEVLQNALPKITIEKISPQVLGQMHDLIEFELLTELKYMVETKEDAAAIARAKTIINIAAGLN